MGSIRPPADHPESRSMRSIAEVVSQRANGAGHVAHAYPPADPLERVMALDKMATRAIVGIVAITLLVHGTAAARTALIPTDLIRFSHLVEAEVAQHLAETIDIDVSKAPEPPPPPPPPPEPEPDKEKAPPPPPKAEAEPPPPPPAAAQAGKVLTSDPDPNEPVDLTNTVVTGSADSYAGGVSAPSGTSTAAVYDRNARPNGVVGGTGKPTTGPVATTPSVDRSRVASVGGSTDWRCPWPAEADAEQIDEAFAIVQVQVTPDGRPQAVKVLSDPGHGFGREARGCAMRERYTPALDANGNPIAGPTRPIRVHFER